MDGVISGTQLGTFFAWAPLVLGIAIYAIAWMAKRRELAPATPGAHGTTYACAKCGKRGARENMVPQTHEGAVSYYCSNCA